MKEIVIATSNKGKIEEFVKIFPQYKVLSLKDIGYDQDIVEDGSTFLENSLIKAKTISQYLNKIGRNAMVLADDSGLCVHAINNEPGIYSARYVEDHNPQANRNKVLEKLQGKTDRSAHFTCTIVAYFPDQTYEYAEGNSYGVITPTYIPRKRDFAYDPIFHSTELDANFGDLTIEEKNCVSHRGRAIKNILPKIQAKANMIEICEQVK